MNYIGLKLKQANRESIICSIFAIILGIFMILFSNTILDIIFYLIGITIIISGIVKIYYYYKYQGRYDVFNYDLSFGIINIILGIFCIAFKTELQAVFRIIIGIFIIYEGILRISFSIKLNYVNKKFGILSLLLSLLIIISGIYIAFYEGILIVTIGYILIMFSVINIIDGIIFKKNLKRLEKFLKDKNN